MKFSNLFPIIVLITAIVSCGTESETSEIPEQYHGVWSTSYTSGSLDIESYIDISPTSITHHRQRESSSDRCFEDPNTYLLLSGDGRTFTFEDSQTSAEITFSFSEPEEICDSAECWVEMSVNSFAVYDAENYSLNQEPFTPSPQCFD